MIVTVIAEAHRKIDRFFNQWGVSFLINDSILFDAFSDPGTLEKRFRRYRIEPDMIEQIVISHDHWDHTGGLEWILSRNRKAKVISCNSVPDIFKERLRLSGNPVLFVGKGIHKIQDSIYSTGEMHCEYKGTPLFEQAVVVEENDSLIVVTGCAHPGINTMVNSIESLFSKKIKLLIGGFHLTGKTNSELDEITGMLVETNIEYIAPCHCTGKGAIKSLKKRFGCKCLSIKPGTVIDTAELY
jgi:7,8-dihydropterin-6-yl-methyl-4-(beta-D-ribofuranosyl)aminobenzene 5'-phosphate synthase